MAVATGFKLLAVCFVVCKIQYYEQMKDCDNIHMSISKVQKQNGLFSHAIKMQ